MVNVQRLPMPIMESYDWQYDGLCRKSSAEMFFSPDAERGEPKRRREEAAKALCDACPVLQECRSHALSVREPYGVWGGLSESDRDQLLQAQRVA